MARGEAVKVILTVFYLIATCSGRDIYRCPSSRQKCEIDAEPCTTGEDCSEDQLCCLQDCGRVCVDPVLTGCENVKRSLTRVMRAINLEENIRSGDEYGGQRLLKRSIRTPRCRSEDGEFEPVQCDNEINPSCWCVDQKGFEIAGTRAPSISLVKCNETASCAAYTCRMLCPLGFELDSRGCPLCKCHNPCENVPCPSPLACQLEEKPCLNPPCPPLPSCKRARSLDNVCPMGEPLLMSETERPFLCGNDEGKPNCPPLYRCLVDYDNDYGVCCPASLELKKVGTCPVNRADPTECGAPCSHDLECHSFQKCCEDETCSRHCITPTNVTECLQQKMLAELLIVNEKEGKGYIPQCSPTDGLFENRQCSRNGLVCWCVDSHGVKLRGSMGPAENVNCTKMYVNPNRGREMGGSRNKCDKQVCASVCEYGYKTGLDGCPTCECDDPCAGFPCKSDEECIRVKDASCSGTLCSSYPVCRPRLTYENPCEHGTPLTNETTGEIVSCAQTSDCPEHFSCTQISELDKMLCCPVLQEKSGICPLDLGAMCGKTDVQNCSHDAECSGSLKCCASEACGLVCVDPTKYELQQNIEEITPSICQYLRDFDSNMEGTQDGMKLALYTPRCHNNGSFEETQCANTDNGHECWCVDGFGTEIPRTRGTKKPLSDCVKLRTEIGCLDMTCRMGCDYGFQLDPETRCPTCHCRDPCNDVTCPVGHECKMIDVACDGEYCPAVPACLTKRLGQCPYMIPDSPGSCEILCKTDEECPTEQRCCPNGCGTSCAKVLQLTSCEHRRSIALHDAAENGTRASTVWIPQCREEDGLYEKIQCRPSAGVCWCVDESGAEIPMTRTNNGTVLVCDAEPTTDKCPELTCALECEHGFVLDDGGCPKCECHDPCSDIKCNEDEECSLVDVECRTGACPKIARCVSRATCPGEAVPLSNTGVVLTCGPGGASCPSTHSCQLQPHRNLPSVCCPKPRTVCFESLDRGKCEQGDGENYTRWYFNPAKNRCEMFFYHGCTGNHNNFHTEEMCKAVCPVLSPCERLRERNAITAKRYSKPTFKPSCDPETGDWMHQQCMDHIDVCWCVNPKGEPQKGTLVRGGKPDCNFRKARMYSSLASPSDGVLEELIRLMTTYRISDFEETELNTDSNTNAKHFDVGEITPFESKCNDVLNAEIRSTGTAVVRCEANGAFKPTQCTNGTCWCVDEMGNVLPDSAVFPATAKNKRICKFVGIESVFMELVYKSLFAAEAARDELESTLKSLGDTTSLISLKTDGLFTSLTLTLRGPGSARRAYHVEKMAREAKENDSKAAAEIIRIEHRTAAQVAPPMRHREILTESTISATTSYHTAIIVLAATSAFIISVLSLLLMLYKKKVSKLAVAEKLPPSENRFLQIGSPVYVLSNDEKKKMAQTIKINETQSARL